MTNRRPVKRTSPLRSARVAGLAAAVACSALSASARADSLGDALEDFWNGRPEKVCPLVFGSGCQHTLSADLVVAHQPTESADNGKETYLRSGVEVAYAHRIARDLHLGPTVEFGAQDGQFMTGFHIVPKLRARYWIAGSGFSLDLATGGYFGRSWLDTGTAPRNRLGIQLDGGLGIFGALHFVGGVALLGEPTGLYGEQKQVFVGARVSLLTLLFIVAAGLKR